MDDLMLIIGVAGMFLLRIGIPVLLLITLGVLIDRWQSKRENDVRLYQKRHMVSRSYDADMAEEQPNGSQIPAQEIAEPTPVKQH